MRLSGLVAATLFGASALVSCSPVDTSSSAVLDTRAHDLASDLTRRALEALKAVPAKRKRSKCKPKCTIETAYVRKD